MKFISIVMGSKSDYNIMAECAETLKKFGVPYELIISSAHRSPERTKMYIQEAEAKGAQVFIAASGMAAHLAGAVAGMTTRPVIGVPIDNGPLQGHDALLSTVMMPGGIPVATVAIGKAGAKNAGYLAAQILGVADQSMADKVKAERLANAKALLAKDDAMQAKLS